MKKKEVINLKDGSRLGNVGDLVIEQKEARIKSIVVLGRLKFFGLCGREEDYVIPWCDIRTIGEDTVLVCIEPRQQNCRKTKKLFDKIFD